MVSSTVANSFKVTMVLKCGGGSTRILNVSVYINGWFPLLLIVSFHEFTLLSLQRKCYFRDRLSVSLFHLWFVCLFVS